MGRSFLESTLIGACPSFKPHWDELTKAYGPGEEPDAAHFCSALALHVQGLAAAGRIAEFSRFAHALERMLTEADPILEELLQRDLVVPLIRAVHESSLEPGLVQPHLGPRTLKLWRQAETG
jgi:hypothetical protein